MLPTFQSLIVAGVMVNIEEPQPSTDAAMMLTLPALRAVIMTPPRVASFCRSTIVESEADQVMVEGSTLPTMAGILYSCTPSKAVYMGEKKICRSLVLQGTWAWVPTTG